MWVGTKFLALEVTSAVSASLKRVEKALMELK